MPRMGIPSRVKGGLQEMRTVVELMIVALRSLTDFNRPEILISIFICGYSKESLSNSLDNYAYLVLAVMLVYFHYLLKMGSALQQYRL